MSDRVRCKFRLDDITMRRGHGPKYDDDGKHVGFEERVLYDAKFIAVSSDGLDDENKKFWQYTPSGHLEVTTIRMMPWEAMLGQEFYLDIIPATQ